MIIKNRATLIILLAAMILLYFFYKHAIFGSDPIRIQVYTHNVFQDPLAIEWNNIKNAIDTTHTDRHYLLESFQTMVTIQGDIQSLDLSFSTMQSSGKKAWYYLHQEMGDVHDTVSMSLTKSPSAQEQGQIDMNDFVQLFNPRTINAMRPREGDAIAIKFNTHFVNLNESNVKKAQRPFYSLIDDQVKGPIRQGNGYLIEVFSMHREHDNSYSSIHGNTFLLGGSQTILN